MPGRPHSGTAVATQGARDRARPGGTGDPLSRRLDGNLRHTHLLYALFRTPGSHGGAQERTPRPHFRQFRYPWDDLPATLFLGDRPGQGCHHRPYPDHEPGGDGGGRVPTAFARRADRPARQSGPQQPYRIRWHDRRGRPSRPHRQHRPLRHQQGLALGRGCPARDRRHLPAHLQFLVRANPDQPRLRRRPQRAQLPGGQQLPLSGPAQHRHQ